MNSHLESGSVVRVRGMIQDMLEAEYYPTTAATKSARRFPMASSRDQLEERTPLVVTPIPFTTTWFRHVFGSACAPEHRAKRLRLDESSTADGGGNNQMDCDNGGGGKKEQWWPENDLKSDPQEVPVLAKLYYDLYGQQPNRLRLNEMVELVGVLEEEETANGAMGDDDNDVVMGANSSWEQDAVTVPTKVPRLHVLWFSSVDLDSVACTQSAILASSNNNVAPTQSLAKALSIPEPSAAAVWMTLLSMAEREMLTDSDTWAPVQTPNDTTLGCASLGMILSSTQACEAFQATLYSVLSHVAPVVNYLHVTNESLKDLRAPWKKQGRLTPTALQLPKGSTLIVNVSAVQPGRLSSDDLETMQALQQLSGGHKIPYRFDGGIKIAFEADCRVFVLSTPVSKNLLPCTLQVKCDYNAVAASDGSAHDLSTVRDTLGAIRCGGTGTKHHANIALSPALLDKAQQDFIQRRGTARNNSLPAVTERDFHRWLTLCRLQARSRKAATAEVEDWSQALSVDDAMVASLQ